MTNRKITFIILFTTLFILCSCTKKENFIIPDFIGTWTVVSFDNNVSMTKIIKTDTNTWPQFNNGDISVSFSSTNSSTGGISGRNVTNSFNGSFEITSDSNLVVNTLLWTEIGEPLWGQLFHVIESVETFELNGDRLIIFYNEKKNSITLTKN